MGGCTAFCLLFPFLTMGVCPSRRVSLVSFVVYKNTDLRFVRASRPLKRVQLITKFMMMREP